jgi:hypothetical protein
MNIQKFTFGKIRIDGKDYEHDVIINRGKVSKRRKKASKAYRERFGHTPLSLNEDVPWDCRCLIIGTGAHGSLPVMEEVKREAQRRDVDLLIVTTKEAIAALNESPKKTNAVLHVTC